MIDLMTLALIKKYCKQAQQNVDTKADSLQKQIDALVNGMVIVGESTTDPLVDGATVSGVSKYKKGNVVLYKSCEYVLVGNTNAKDNWIKLGADSSLTKDDADKLYTQKQIDNQDRTQSLLFNEQDGGGSKFVGNTTDSFVGTNDGSQDIYAELYAIDKATKQGPRLIVGKDKLYYTVKDNVSFSDDDEVTTKKELEEVVSSGISDLYFNLEKNLNQEDTAKTLINIKNKSGGSSVVVEVDNLDIVSPIPQHEVLGAVKGKDIEDRLIAIEKNPLSVIELSADISEDDKAGHNFPQLSLSKEQIEKIVNSDVTMLKVKFNVAKSSGTEVDTLVFYTTIDSIETSNGSGVTVKNVKINAIRTNDEGTIVYHGELIGAGDTFSANIDLTAAYVPHSIS